MVMLMLASSRGEENLICLAVLASVHTYSISQRYSSIAVKDVVVMV